MQLSGAVVVAADVPCSDRAPHNSRVNGLSIKTRLAMCPSLPTRVRKSLRLMTLDRMRPERRPETSVM
eukprot:7967860-Heterocapsa_arctica.AAC.1